jgi:hypothetical protein
LTKDEVLWEAQLIQKQMASGRINSHQNIEKPNRLQVKVREDLISQPYFDNYHFYQIEIYDRMPSKIVFLGCLQIFPISFKFLHLLIEMFVLDLGGLFFVLQLL